MTALKRYARLECPGLWRPTPDAKRLEVVVAFRHASLVIYDLSGQPMTHWSLAAVARINPGDGPALYTPSADATEVLEVSDEIMVDAIETVRSAVERARPRSGRLRVAAVSVTMAGFLSAALWWAPEALVRHAVAVLPEPARAEIGAEVFAALSRVSAAPCHAPRADRALAELAIRLGQEEIAVRAGAAVSAPLATRAAAGRWTREAAPAGYVVVPDGIEGARTLPGGIVLVGRALVEDYDGPDVLAGHLVAAGVRAEADPPLALLLKEAGSLATIHLLTTGKLPRDAVSRYAETLLAEELLPLDPENLIEGFSEASVPTTPYAYALDVTGETVLALIEGDPLRGRAVPPVMSDAEWVAVQNMCGPR